MRHLTVLSIATAVLLTSCEALTGKEIARLSINEVSVGENSVIKEVELDLNKGDEIALWSHMDLEYDGDVEMRFQVQVQRDTVIDSEIEVDPFEMNVTIGETKTLFGGHTNWSFTGKNGTMTISETGRCTVRARLIASENSSLQLRKAELILKK